MPFIHVTSNVPSSSVKVDAAIRAVSKSLSATLQIPEERIMAQLTLDTPMLFQASDAPCAFVYLRIIGFVSEEQNKKTSAVLSKTVGEVLHLAADRVFLNFVDMPPANWGCFGTIASELM